MAGPEYFGQIAVIARALILIGNVKGYGRACGATLEHAGEQAQRVGLFPLGGGGPLAGLAQIQLCLNVGFAQLQTGRAAVQHAAQTRPVGFSKRGQTQDAPEGIASHVPPRVPRAVAPLWVKCGNGRLSAPVRIAPRQWSTSI